MEPLQTPEQLQWVSNLAHWIEGGHVCDSCRDRIRAGYTRMEPTLLGPLAGACGRGSFAIVRPLTPFLLCSGPYSQS